MNNNKRLNLTNCILILVSSYIFLFSNSINADNLEKGVSKLKNDLESCYHLDKSQQKVYCIEKQIDPSLNSSFRGRLLFEIGEFRSLSIQDKQCENNKNLILKNNHIYLCGTFKSNHKTKKYNLVFVYLKKLDKYYLTNLSKI